jgi:hypothetical protein
MFNPATADENVSLSGELEWTALLRLLDRATPDTGPELTMTAPRR